MPRRTSAHYVLQASSLALPRDLTKTYLYHITDISNLPSILVSGGLLSDCALAGVAHQVIGYPNIKQRRMTQYRVPCCGNRFVGEFVPFYFCPRSPMLYTVNRGNTGRQPGCQTSIVHLVTTVSVAVKQGRPFAISDGNAAPDGSPDAADMPNRTLEPELTTGRAALIALIDGYLKGLLDPNVTLLEIHKLMYFLQEAGQDLKLQYEAQSYGPYARNLRHVLDRLEGHMLIGFGDGSDRPDKPIELTQGAVEKASTYLAEDAHTIARIARVQKLIEGFEDPYGLEILSSVHWVMCRDRRARDSAGEAVKAVLNWNERKKRLIRPVHIEAAWQRLHSEKWATESRSAIH